MYDDTILKDVTEETNEEIKNMYLNFNIGDEVYGIEIKYVLQIVGMQEIVEMPDMPPTMKGFIHMRGSAIPIVSTRLRFGRMEEEYTERTCIIVVQVGDKEIGLIVDAIRETITIEPDQILPPPGTGEGMDNPYVIGIAQLPDESVAILINIQKLFNGHQF